jgi:hypothetical protein
MPSQAQDIVAVRTELWSLLHQQIEVLSSPLGLTDSQLMECYDRQSRVQELREKLETILNPTAAVPAPLDELSIAAPARTPPECSIASLESAA